MKIEAGKYYKTRGGRKAFVVGINPNAVDFCAVGWIDRGCLTWTLRGTMYGSSQHEDDLVAEWVEPVVVTRSFLMLRYGDSAIAIIQKGSLAPEGATIVGRYTVTFTEGEGMEGGDCE